MDTISSTLEMKGPSFFKIGQPPHFSTSFRAGFFPRELVISIIMDCNISLKKTLAFLLY